ncbi:MAG: hypothetical protein J6A53_09030 [Clostridia bacterium]|nr:hypothetical protein [Clostridia bacterium]MBO5440784.1 hypothetical protein [Clostridia bacterium]
MTSFKKYFSYQLKRSLPRLSTIALISLLITMIFTRLDLILYENVFLSFTDVTLALPFIMITLCITIPILELAPFKNRRNLDTLMFLPVSRLKMSIAHYLNGLVQIVSVFLLCSLYTLFYLLKKINDFSLILGYVEVPFSINYFVPYVIFILLFGIAIYSIYMFVISSAGTLIDGIAFQLFYSVGLFFVALAIKNILAGFTSLKFYNAENFIIFDPIIDLPYHFKKLMLLEKWDLTAIDYISFIMWGILGIASIFGFILTFKKQKAEKIGDISTSVFGYKTLIPVLGYSMMISVDTSLDLGFQLLLILAMYVGYIIYRRSARLKKADYICLASSILPIFLSLIIH